jgi:polyhydroxybutyrate depolymerase
MMLVRSRASERASFATSALLLIVLFTGCAAAADPANGQSGPLAPGNHTFSLRHDGRTRDYIVHVPPAATRRSALPLMLAFHGGGGNASGFQAYAGLDSVADAEEFLVMYPNGTGPFRQRLLTWNGGGCCGWAKDRNIDDVGFTMAAVQHLAARTRIDPQRIYATGHSNGAIMAYRLAAERADRIAAIVPVAGAMSLSSFSPSQAVPVLHIHSTDDPRALYNGGLGPPFPLTDHREMHEPVQSALDQWARANRCGSNPQVSETRHGRPGAPDALHTATLLIYPSCQSGADVAHWKLTVTGHAWPGSKGSGLPEGIMGPTTTVLNAAVEAWSFASRFRRN